MRPLDHCKFLLVFFFFCLAKLSYAQLHYEDFVFDGADGGALLDYATSVTTSPDGVYVYVTSSESNAINVFKKDASSPDGKLTFVALYKSGVDGVQGLTSAQSIVISPDGNNAYAIGTADDALVSFNRNNIDGTLTYTGMHKDGLLGVDGLDAPYQVIISPDGKHVYVSASDDKGISIFSRDPMSGLLTFSEKVENGIDNVSGLQIVFGINISPDGEHLYAAGHAEDKLVAFSRDANTGSLTFVGTQTDDVNGVDGLDGPFNIFVSADGNHVYATGAYDNSVAVFSRNALTGVLSYVNDYKDEVDGGSNLNFPVHVNGSSDGNYIYVAGANDNSISTFTRNPNTGELTFHESKTESVDNVSGINFPVNIAVSPDDEFIYTASSGSGAVAVFNKNNVGFLDLVESKTSGGAGVDGLNDPYGVAISPDGVHLYVASNDDDAVAIFSRDQNSGKINFIDMVQDGIDGVEGLYKASHVAVSPDGAHVYATGNSDDAVTIFSRDEVTGELTFVEFIKDNLNGVDGLNGARWVTVSPDGNNVYVVGYFDDAIATFSRDPNTGELTFVNMQKDSQNGVDGLKRANSVIISPDGLYAYASGYTDDAIAVFTRNPIDGTLTYLTNYKNGLIGINGLNGAHSVILSHDGLNVYACGFNDNAVVVFSRDPASGLLTFIESYFDGMNGVDGLGGVRAIAMNPDDQHFYAVSSGENAIVLFERDPVKGKLTYQTKQEDGISGVDGLSGARSLIVDNNGRFIYVGGSSDDALSIFSCTYFESVTKEICEGEVFSIGNNTYSQTGIFKDTLAEAVGCRTITNVDLTVYLNNENLSKTICSGEEYMFGGAAITASGIYEETTTSSAGCTVTTTLNLTVTEQSQSNIAATICGGETYQVGNNTFNSSGTYTTNVATAAGCDSLVILDLVVENSTYELEKTICSGSSFVLGNNSFDESGMYEETFTSATGCDSVVTLQLLVINELTETIEATICSGSTYTLGNNSYTQSGIYQENFTSYLGCDSIVTLDLQVKSSSINFWKNHSICEGDSYEFQGTSYSESGVYTHNYITPTGCDSTFTLNLFVLPNPPQHIKETVCAGETFSFGSNEYAQSGKYVSTFYNPNGCEQIVTLDLTVEEEGEVVVDKIICEGEAYVFGNNSLTQTGVYNEQLTSIAGCDSVVRLNLTVTPAPKEIFFKTICQGDFYTLGNTNYNTTGTYQKTFTSDATGCDSIVELNLSVVEVNAFATITNDNGSENGSIDITPTNGTPPYSFEWIDGSEEEDRTGLATGHYLVTITDDNSCSKVVIYNVDFSTPTENIESIRSFDAKIQPNPVASYTTFNLDLTVEKAGEFEIKMYDMRGQILRSEYIELDRGKHLHAIPSPNVEGLYFIQILNNSKQIGSLKLMVHNEK